MDPNTVIGLGILAATLALVLGAVAWARSDAKGSERERGEALLLLERDRRERAERALEQARRVVAALQDRARSAARAGTALLSTDATVAALVAGGDLDGGIAGVLGQLAELEARASGPPPAGPPGTPDVPPLDA